jgi:hypothetical protein
VTPSVVIRLALKARPRVLVDAVDEREYPRFPGLLEANPELLALLDRAYLLERKAA